MSADEPNPAADPAEIRTERLFLRRWRREDRAPFSAINADPRVMRWLPRLLTRAESDAFIDRIEQHFEDHGFGLWAVELKGEAELIGAVGLLRVSFEAHFAPAVEVGWRLTADRWGVGYATEASAAALAWGFDSLDLDEIVAFTVPDNTRSRAVMERLGMTHDPADDFEHPRLAEDSPLRHHVLYRKRRK